ncbi:flg new: flagellar operon protein [Lucifera butyrica]|uniref:Flg new: flagellar operon protein n=1 Tax=Lucifera butyrica TaxID=1351585 RepID=A0A498R9N4_9FIRM|nr:TIGR02530 family flagellar biosynthesis protein [Lucifera butyrica]VBB08091.1 flg new: flagellar operon protein [Lucifera butyrica]
MSDQRIYYSQQPVFIPAGNAPTFPQPKNQSRPVSGSASFDAVLDEKLSGLTFSQHARQRLESRNIQLSREELMKLSGAVEKAAQKGAKESLVLMDNLALIVSVKNKTVITAMDGTSIRDNVFTNIDSAVVV